MSEQDNEHAAIVVEQFSCQATPFARIAGHLDGIELLIELAKPAGHNVALDIACGPGLVTCAFAPKVSSIEGIDITAAMIAAARRRQQQAGLVNVSWSIGRVEALPYPDARFDLVVTRYSFHHLLRPRQALVEMLRVCRPGGRILIADVVQPPEKAAAYDRMEKIRDPSHTRVLVTGEMDAWFAELALVDCQQAAYGITFELEEQLRASFPEAGGETKLRQIYVDDLGIDALGVNTHRIGSDIHYTVPVVAYAGNKRNK